MNRLSIHSIGNFVHKGPCETSIKYHLAKLDLPNLENVNSHILTYAADPLLKKGKKYQFAIDLTNDPYYGKIDDTNADYVIRSRPKKSTTYFYSYVSLYTIRKGERLTVAVFPVKKGVRIVEYVRRCMETIQNLDVNVEVLCLDNAHLLQFLTEKLYTVEGVREAETFIYLDIVKEIYAWDKPASQFDLCVTRDAGSPAKPIRFLSQGSCQVLGRRWPFP